MRTLFSQHLRHGNNDSPGTLPIRSLRTGTSGRCCGVRSTTGLSMIISTPTAARWLPLLLVHLRERTLHTTLEGDLHTISAYSVELPTIRFANRSWGAIHDPLPGTALLSIERALARRNIKSSVYQHYDTQLLVIRFESRLLGGFALPFLGGFVIPHWSAHLENYTGGF